MEYTKGEWEYTEELGANFSRISSTEEVVCGLPNPIPSDSYDKELIRMRANAHLIAAAPEMYEALKALHQPPKSRITDCPADISSAPCVCGWHDAMDNAMEALSKAEGK